MATLRTANIFCTFIILSLTTSGAMAYISSQPMKGVYWPSWAINNLPPSAIETSLFTHIYYAFLNPNRATFRLHVSNSTALILLNFTSTLHTKNPPVKTLFSIGGGGSSDDALVFARMASSSSSRKIFIDSTIEVARNFGFDGIDLDWEFPENPEDMRNLGLLLHEWRAAVEVDAKHTGRPPLLLSAATYFSVDFFLARVYRKFPVDSISKNLDWINAMCYDYHGSWDTSATGAHAALFDSRSNISTSYGLRSWIQAGLPRRKLVMGLPLYGKSWTLANPASHGIRAPAVGVGPGNSGILTYSQVETFNKENNVTVVYDTSTVSTYSFVRTSWIGYDDVRSTSTKVRYARGLGIRGYFFWAANGDHKWKISKSASQSWGQ